MLNKTLELALQSDMHKRMACIIADKRGRPISMGVNKRKTHPTQMHYAKRAKFPSKVFLHAEIAALVKCREKGHTLYVGRILKDGSAALARPCPICLEAIKEAGIKEVVYTGNSGEISYLKIS